MAKAEPVIVGGRVVWKHITPLVIILHGLAIIQTRTLNTQTHQERVLLFAWVVAQKTLQAWARGSALFRPKCMRIQQTFRFGWVAQYPELVDASRRVLHIFRETQSEAVDDASFIDCDRSICDDFFGCPAKVAIAVVVYF